MIDGMESPQETWVMTEENVKKKKMEMAHGKLDYKDGDASLLNSCGTRTYSTIL